MKIHEYQAREFFIRYGIPTPVADVAKNKDEVYEIAKKIGKRVVIKAQVQVGGRGKAGGVKLANNPDEAREIGEKILNMEIKGIKVKRVLVMEAVDILKEFYIGIIVDRRTKRPVIMVSPAGGVDIEEVAKKTPEKIYKLTIDPLYGVLQHQARNLAQRLFDNVDFNFIIRTAEIIMRLYKLFIETDASIAEINPFVLTKNGELLAIDSKINFDDNALFRHPEYENLKDLTEDEKIEEDAKKAGLSFIKLSGNIGCVVNGAGLAMATMDVIKYFGGEPANFLDVGGSSNPEKVKNAMNILLKDKNVKSIWFNIFGGITRCDDIAKGLVEAMKGIEIKIPIVVRITGTNEELAKEIIKDSKLPIIFANTMSEGAKMAIKSIGGSNERSR
uniref:Succinate--CoA ligase [ADP-forming] subunit beta n=1 Tax=candidate division WOR-3 bacterium TaxID=2052148 RepID=A0A7C4UER7_UNCW3